MHIFTHKCVAVCKYVHTFQWEPNEYPMTILYYRWRYAAAQVRSGQVRSDEVFLDPIHPSILDRGIQLLPPTHTYIHTTPGPEISSTSREIFLADSRDDDGLEAVHSAGEGRLELWTPQPSPVHPSPFQREGAAHSAESGADLVRHGSLQLSLQSENPTHALYLPHIHTYIHTYYIHTYVHTYIHIQLLFYNM